ncbi:hypothetical protein GOP47_0005104 [Adiantum capillus-veneris]|uniref:Replication protein A subunit n=1 Tax=Adiantum capillus-veneris TaxID=13818 RepID=A0A9D4V544_ADICA|nr:hypothetical protein GOP47_0005104 [Adiantum capillus-veneris]
MASAPALTSNSISAIAGGDTNLRPLLQVLDVKEIKASQADKRFRLLLSDGSFVQQSVLATQLNSSVLLGEIKQGSILQLLDFVCLTIRGLRFLMVLNMEVIGFSADTIGHPKQFLFNDKEASGKAIAQQESTSNDMSMRNGCAAPVGPAQQSVTSTKSPSTSGPDARPLVSPSYEPAPIYSNKGPIARNQAPARILPIVALTPYVGRWAIKDGDGGEIRATCFNSIADQFMDKIEVGKLYMVSKGKLRPAERSFNHMRHDYEITLENSSMIELLGEDDDSIPQQQFKFTPIAAIENADENSMVDVLGIVVGVSPTNTILRKNGTETEKRTVQLRDASGCSVEITMWGSFCAREGNLLQEACNSGQTPILAVKAGRISAFSGKSVGTISSTQLLVDPDLLEAKQLRAWFEGGGKASSFQPISHEGCAGARGEMRKTVSQIKDEGLGRSGRPDWVAVKGSISFVKTDKFCYTACPLIVMDRPCNRKVTIRSDNKWYCDRCDKLLDDCEYRYLLSLQVQDHTGVTWVTAFQEAAEDILGVSAKELQSWKGEEDWRFEDVIHKVLFTQRLFKLKVKEETYNDELSVKCSVLRAEQLNYHSENKVVLDSIRSLIVGDHQNQEIAGNGSSVPSFSGAAGFMSSNSPVSPSKYTAVKSSRSMGGSANFSSSNSSCFKCGKSGHWVKDCPSQGSGRFR